MLHKGFVDDLKLKKDIRNVMYEKGIYVSDLAKELGYSKNTLYRYLTDKKHKSLPVAIALIEKFNLEEREYNLLCQK